LDLQDHADGTAPADGRTISNQKHHAPSVIAAELSSITYLKRIFDAASIARYFFSPFLIFPMLVLALLALPLLSTASVHQRHNHDHLHNAAKRLPSTWFHHRDHPGLSEYFRFIFKRD
jgi:hypothetical protein